MSTAHRVGWSLFLVSAALFTAAGIRAGDVLVIIGSLAFGLACVVFLLAKTD